MTGIVVFNNGVIQDDIDRAYGFVVLTPALIKEAIAVSPAAGAPSLYGLQLDHGANDVRTVEQEIVHLVPPGSTYQFHVTSRVVTEVELAIKPESVALGGFGAIAALVCLVLGIQAISRQLRSGDEDRRVMRSLGAGPLTTAGDGLIGLVGAVVLGSLVAVGVAVGLSPLSPLGPVRPVYPDGGIDFDWTVLGVGLAVLVVVLGVAAVALSYRGAPHRVARIGRAGTGSSRLVRRAESAGMPVAGVVGSAFRPRTRTGTHRGAGAFGNARAPSSPSSRWWPPSPSPAACEPWWRIHRSTAGTGATRSTRPTTSRPKP